MKKTADNWNRNNNEAIIHIDKVDAKFVVGVLWIFVKPESFQINNNKSKLFASFYKLNQCLIDCLSGLVTITILCVCVCVCVCYVLLNGSLWYWLLWPNSEVTRASTVCFLRSQRAREWERGREGGEKCVCVCERERQSSKPAPRHLLVLLLVMRNEVKDTNLRPLFSSVRACVYACMRGWTLALCR